MKKCGFALAIVFGFAFTPPAEAQNCAKIKDGSITDSANNVLTPGFDQFGYNYQARMFNGLYDNFSRPLPPATEGSVNLIMKWSDEWLSNLDCNGDGRLDRGLNAKTGVSTGGSKGWLTNHEEGDYLGGDGEYHHYSYFVKIVYDGGAACLAGDDSCIWGVYSVIEEVYNDPYGGTTGVDRSRLKNPAGLGFYTNQ